MNGSAKQADIEVCNARKKTAKQYADAARQLTADAKMFADAGDLKTANKKFTKAAAVAKKSASAYKAIATTVKSEWTPATSEDMALVNIIVLTKMESWLQNMEETE